MAIICFKSASIKPLLSFEQMTKMLVEINKIIISVLVITLPIKKTHYDSAQSSSVSSFYYKILPLIMHENILKLFFETLQMIHSKKINVKRIELSILFL